VYSYATCGGSANAFKQDVLFKELNGKTMKVGLNSNSGGWTG
jgi:hypothetical protein